MVKVVDEMGPLGILIYILAIMTAIVISPIPGTPLTIVAGAIWGPFSAALYGTIGSTLGCLIAYFIGRTFGRPAIKVLTGKVIYLGTHRGEIYMGFLLFLIRLFPGLPFDIVSYGAGLAKLSLPIFAGATVLGAFPSNFLLASMGAAFSLNRTTVAILVVVGLIVLVGLPWGARRYNWLGIRDVIRFE